MLLVATLAPTFARADSDMQVVTTIAPLYALTAGVMEGISTPELLLKQGDSPHHFSMRPNDAQRVSKADIVIATHRAYAYYLEPLIKQMPERKTIFVEALNIPGIVLLPADEKQHSKKVLSGAYVDMHFWLNPRNAIAYTHYIAELLSNTDPNNTMIYTENAIQQVTRIKNLDSSIKALLGPTPLQAHYASYHPSLAYFEKYYGIKGGKAITRSPETGASAAEAEALYKNIANGTIRCLFEEPEFSPRLLQQTAQHYVGKVRVITLDPLGSTYALDANFYDTLLLNVATHIKECTSPVEKKK